MKKISIFLIGINFFLSVITSITIKHYLTFANIFIAFMMMLVIIKAKSKDKYLINSIWSVMFFVYNTVALGLFFYNNTNIYEDKYSFFWQYVLFAIIALIIKIIYHNRNKKTK